MSDKEPEIKVFHRQHESGYTESHTFFPAPPGPPWYRRYWKWLVAAVTFFIAVGGWLISNYQNLKEIRNDLVPKPATESKPK
ncbi:MAG: hypothetical protein JNJ83_13445 [Verrucomicrobiaceae bacterium]|nr:hypothetical protein [Verrucomicrobiaceae bacterium]